MNKVARYFAWCVGRHWFAPIALFAGTAAAVGGWKAAAPSYRHWKSAHATARARALHLEGKDHDAALALEVALQAEPSMEAYRLLGDVCESLGSRQAIDARRAAHDLRPGDAGFLVDLAATDVRFGELTAAREALEAVPAASRAGAPWIRVSAALALLTGDTPEASHLLDQPGATPEIRLLSDSLAAQGGDRPAAQRAYADLRSFSDDPRHTVPALRALMAAALARRDPRGALGAARRLGTEPAASLDDWLDAARIECQTSTGHQADPHLLASIRSRSHRDPVSAARYGRWLLLNSGPGESAAWLAALPAKWEGDSTLAEVRADVSAARGDWPALRAAIKRGAWGAMPANAAEFAFGARLLRQTGNIELAGHVWSAALSDCAGSRSGLRVLARLAGVWNWPGAVHDSLLLTVRNFPDDDRAFDQLMGMLQSRGDTRGLLELFYLRKEALTPSLRRTADWALLSLLVSPANHANTATRALDELYAREPTDPYVVTDRAFALWQEGDAAAACTLLDRLPDYEKRVPARAPYLAAIYAGAHRWREVQAALAFAPDGRRLLPEESALVALAAKLDHEFASDFH